MQQSEKLRPTSIAILEDPTHLIICPRLSGQNPLRPELPQCVVWVFTREHMAGH